MAETSRALRVVMTFLRYALWAALSIVIAFGAIFLLQVVATAMS